MQYCAREIHVWKHKERDWDAHMPAKRGSYRGVQLDTPARGVPLGGHFTWAKSHDHKIVRAKKECPKAIRDTSKIM